MRNWRDTTAAETVRELFDSPREAELPTNTALPPHELRQLVLLAHDLKVLAENLTEDHRNGDSPGEPTLSQLRWAAIRALELVYPTLIVPCFDVSEEAQADAKARKVMWLPPDTARWDRTD